MSQSLTSPSVSQEIHASLTSKGQVTIPVAVRKHLQISPHDKIAFVIQPEGTVQIKTPKYPTIASLKGAAGTLKNPLSEQEMEEIIRDDVAEAYKEKFLR